MTPLPSFIPSLVRLAPVALLAFRLVAQCQLAFVPGDPVACPAGPPSAMQVWDPDGSGPAPDLLVVGGQFAVATGSDVAVAAWDGVEWRSLGAPAPGVCTALGVFGGQLVVAISRSVTSSAILTYDGAVWRTIGAMRGVAHAMAPFGRGLVLGGEFSHVDGLPAANVVAWDGTAWSPLGPGAGGVTGTVHALAAFTEGLYVGGAITHANGIPVGNLAIWNGTTWAASASCTGTVRTLAAFRATSVANSFLFVGGTFGMVSTVVAPGVARFHSLNGWSALGAGIPGGCRSLLVRSTGPTTFELNAGATAPASVLRWNGSAWNPVGTGAQSFGTPVALARFRGTYVAAAERHYATVRALDAAGEWLPLSGSGIDGPITAIHATATDVVIAGLFTFISGVRMNGIARGGPGAWRPLGSGIDEGGVTAITELPGGDIVIGGYLTSVGGVGVQNIARWDGSAWSPLGAGVAGGLVHALAVAPDGQLVAGGTFTVAGGQGASLIAKWDGANWSPLRTGLWGLAVMALTVAGNGEVIAGGSFDSASGVPAANLARWTGTTWLPFPGQPNGPVDSLATLSTGEVLVGGGFSAVGTVVTSHLARWQIATSTWRAVPGYANSFLGQVNAIVPLAAGEAIVSTGMLGPTPFLARFDGQAIAAGSLPAAYFGAGARVRDGDLMFGGGPTAIGSVPTGFAARLVSPCPALAPAFGTGCTGSGGANVLRWTALPWVGGVFRGEASGMPGIGIALGITGVSATSIPLAGLLRQGLPGCNLLATPDLIEMVAPRAGAASTSLAVPVLPALVGQVVHHQVLAFELDGGGNLIAVTGSNGLRLTIGMF